MSPPGASRPNPRRPVLLFCGLSPSALRLVPLPQYEPALGGLRVKTSRALSPPGTSRPNPRRPVLWFCGLSPSALRLVTTSNPSPRLAALGSKPRVRCPRRAPQGKTRGDLYSRSAAVSPPSEVQPVIDATAQQLNGIAHLGRAKCAYSRMPLGWDAHQTLAGSAISTFYAAPSNGNVGRRGHGP